MTQTREEWLNAFIAAARPKFEEIGFPIPAKVRASIGFPSAGGRSNVIGECWADTCSEDQTFEIFLHPGDADTARVAGTLSHELVHAAVGLDKQHGPVFKKAATALGHEGKMTSTTEGEAWFVWAQPILDALGPLPHARLASRRTATGRTPTVVGGTPSAPGGLISSRPPAQTNRHLKIECNECGISLRGTRKQFDKAGPVLRCVNPSCDGEMERKD